MRVLTSCLVQYLAFSRCLPWCRRHLTCPVRGTYCALCQQNPNRRCEIGNNFAPKQLEKQPLTASCGSSIQISLKHLESVYKGNEVLACSASSQTAQKPEGLCLEVRCQYQYDTPCISMVHRVLKSMSCHRVSLLDGLHQPCIHHVMAWHVTHRALHACAVSAAYLLGCQSPSRPQHKMRQVGSTYLLMLQFSLLSASLHDQWLQQMREGVTMSEDTRLACEVLRSRKAGKVRLFPMSPGQFIVLSHVIAICSCCQALDTFKHVCTGVHASRDLH